MKRLIIIGEGQTEQAFCHDVLQPYFTRLNVQIQNPTIKKSKGGIVEWKILKKEITYHLQDDPSAIISMLIDYYGIHKKHGFPHWAEALRIADKNQRMDFLEQAMYEDIEERYRHRFIPYIQLHEFEGLLFCDKQVFDDNFEDEEFTDYHYLEETFQQFNNPEEINDGNTTAPSKRLARIITGYRKTVYGPLLAGEIGLPKIRSKCPRFNDWIEKLSRMGRK
jgi:hypothetical protein